MNTLKCVVTGLVLPFVLGLMAQAADEGGQRREKSDAEGRGPSLLPPGIERLDLNASQKERIARLQKAFREKLEGAQKRFTEAREKARQNQDPQKAEEVTEAFRKETARFQEEFQGRLQQVLTEEQKQRLAQLRQDQPPGGIGALPRILEQLDLTEEQKEKFGMIMKEFQEKQEAAQKKVQEAVEQGKRDLQEKVQELSQAHQQDMAKLLEWLQVQVQQLLTEEQKQRFAEVQRRLEGRPSGPGIGELLPPPIQEGLGLTPEQREKVAQLQQEMEAKLRGILTEEQNQKFEELKKGGQQPERQRRQDR